MDEDQTQAANRIDIIVGWYFTWDEWGRKSHDCRRGGLCNFRLEAIVITIGRSAQVQGDHEGNLWLDIPITKDMPIEYSYEFFPIDEDMSFTTENEETYVVKAGLYPINQRISKMGGYRLPLEKRQLKQSI